MNCGLLCCLTPPNTWITAWHMVNCQPSCCLWAWPEVWPSWSTESRVPKVTPEVIFDPWFRRTSLGLPFHWQPVGGRSGSSPAFYSFVFQLSTGGLPTNTLLFCYLWSKWLAIVGLILANLILLPGKGQMPNYTVQLLMNDWTTLAVIFDDCRTGFTS